MHSEHKRRTIISSLAAVGLLSSTSITRASTTSNFPSKTLGSGGFVSVADFGAVGNGIADDTQAVQNAFNDGASVIFPSGIYRITDTLRLPHPRRVLGAGMESTVLMFEGMGGFEGTDGLEVQVDQGAPFAASSHISDLTIAIGGSHGRSAITTPRALVGSSNIWSIYRPHFTFERMLFRGGNRIGGGSNVRYDYGWGRYFDIGDSREATFRECYICGCFDDTQNPSISPYSAQRHTVGWYFGGAETGSGGAVFMPQIDHCGTMHVGYSVFFGRRVSNARVLNSQFHRGGYGVFSEIALGQLGASELQLCNLNVNAMFGGIYIYETDFLHVNGVRCTRADGTFDHNFGWVGFEIGALARQVDLQGVRAFDAHQSANASTKVGICLNGVERGGIRDIFIRNANNAKPIAFGVQLSDCQSINVHGVSARGAVDHLVRVDGSIASTPSHHIRGLDRPGRSVGALSISEETSRANLISDDSVVLYGIDQTISVISSTGSEILLARNGNQVIRRGFAKGSGPYTYQLHFSADGARNGDFIKIWLQINMSAGSDPTIVIRDEDGASLLTLNGVGQLKRYSVEVGYAGRWRIISAVETLA